MWLSVQNCQPVLLPRGCHQRLCGCVLLALCGFTDSETRQRRWQPVSLGDQAPSCCRVVLPLAPVNGIAAVTGSPCWLRLSVASLLDFQILTVLEAQVSLSPESPSEATQAPRDQCGPGPEQPVASLLRGPLRRTGQGGPARVSAPPALGSVLCGLGFLI